MDAAQAGRFEGGGGSLRPGCRGGSCSRSSAVFHHQFLYHRPFGSGDGKPAECLRDQPLWRAVEADNLVLPVEGQALWPALRDDGEVAAMTPPILYEDNHLLAAIKAPYGALPGRRVGDPDMLTLLKAYIKEKYQKPGEVYLGLVHRLDQPAGGVMVFARTSRRGPAGGADAGGALSKDIPGGGHGQPAPAGDWEDNLLKDERAIPCV